MEWTSHLDRPDPFSQSDDGELVDKVNDWYGAVCRHTLLRRPIHDAYLALKNPHEALVFVYRGLEWLKVGQALKWKDVAADLKIPEQALKEFTRAVNVESGVRHATFSGTKIRADSPTYATWVCGLLDAVNAARARLEGDFEPMGAREVSEAVARAAPLVPYP